ncbi:fumarylacetoacetate hydrolase family protein [Streptomyces sp. NPDC059785]|uniref:fumarylacetoacetate hydrolase family protein n=1 Tax=unclassified Streptomyces TaxID=2593676 RepID=UPI00365C707C
MSISVLRTADAWYTERDGRAVRIDTGATTTANLLGDRTAVEKAHATAVTGGNSVDVRHLDLVSPVTTPCRVVAQMVNYRSHARDSGMDPGKVVPTFFRKSSGSVCGPNDTVIRPEHVRLLDYEAELGLVLGAALPPGTNVTEENIEQYVAGLVVTDDVSARDVQLPQGQFYEAKSYPTFTPVGPRLVLLEPHDVPHIARLRVRLWVNYVLRQDRTLSDMIVPPAQALTRLARFQQLEPGDLVLTGTPGGTALRSPRPVVRALGSLLPADRRWRALTKRQVTNPAYLQHGDIVTVGIATDDGALDLGLQRTPVEHR